MAITQEAKRISDSINEIPNLSSNSAHKYNETQVVVEDVFGLNVNSSYLYTLSGTGNIVVRAQQVQMQVNKGSSLQIVIAVCTFNFKESTAYSKYALELMNYYGVKSVFYVWKNSSNEYIPQFAYGLKGSDILVRSKEIWPDVNIEEVEVTNNQKESERGSGNNIIFFGAPGTGKSHKVKELTKGKKNLMERIIFHPEFDYSSFVGGYKPIMDNSNIKYEFVPQAFINIYVRAWNSLAEKKDEDFYLVIEEINRGNCAEIFGDIFQLLDRDPDYDISPSTELRDFLLNNPKGLKSKEFGLKEGKMFLPSNLNILATMNTSDQSLFPMDSAFKRRWDWEYIPICYDKKTEDGKPNPSFDYIIDLGSGSSFRWNEFIKEINQNHIQQNTVLGMDKCIGNFFIKPKEGETIINIETFIGKVIFYLWNDVFKDEKNEVFDETSPYEAFFPIKTQGRKKLVELLVRIGIEIETVQKETEPIEDEATN